MTLLGPPQITVAGREITGGLRKARELLAFLAVHPDGATGDQVSEALWPGAPPGHGTAQRNIAVRKLREHAAHRDRPARGHVHHPEPPTGTGSTRRCSTSTSGGSSAPCSQPATPAARTRSWPPAGKRSPPTTARSPTATGYDWAEPYAEQARRRALDAWTRIAEITAPRDPEQALAALETALGHDPYNEFVYQKIMRLQAAAGRPDAVRRTLSLLETRLTELGVTPEPADPQPGRIPPRRHYAQ